MSNGFDDHRGRPGDQAFFAGIGGEDDVEEVVPDEDAQLARTKVIAAQEEPSGTGMTPFLAAGAGGVGAAGLGSYVGGTRGEDRSRAGARVPVGGAVGVPLTPLGDDFGQPHVGHIGADGRVRPEDPWSLGHDDDLPTVANTGATEAAPRLRGTSGTRGAHLGRQDAGSAAPTATLGGFGGVPAAGGANVAAAQSAGNPPGGGIPLSVLQNLQSGRATGTAFSPMSTGVSAAGAGAHPGDPALLYAQALAASDIDGVGTGKSQWLDEQLRRRVGTDLAIDTDIPDAESEPDADEDSGGDRRDRSSPAAAATGGLAGGAGIGIWGSGGTAPRDHASGRDVFAPGGTSGTEAPAVPSTRDWGWDPTPSGAAPQQLAGTRAEDGVSPSAAPGFTPATAGPSAPSAVHGAPPGPSVPAPGMPPPPPTRGLLPGGGGADGAGPGAAPPAGGSDFTVSGDALSEDAEQWRRLAAEMEEIRSTVMSVRDGRSTFGLVTEPAGAYSSATDQVQRWTHQAAAAYEQLAGQLAATARSYDANERSAIGSTGRLFEL